MSDIMHPIELENILNWIFNEYKNHKTIFGIPESSFFRKNGNSIHNIFNDKIETPLGPAAGPHTQLTQNIISAYLTGGRFFELKTVQILDELKIDKPCIDACDEGYNVEWSQELKLEQSYKEYVKAWLLIHLLKNIFNLSDSTNRNFVFNMSVGYNLEGIKTERMDNFIESIKNSSKNIFFTKCIDTIKNFIKNNSSFITDESLDVESISSKISNSVTLSTMHGCPPDEIEAIAKYLIKEKGLHTFIKMNPTLLGFNFVKDNLHKLGYKYIELDPASFDHDMQYNDAIPMLKRMKTFAKEHQLEFGVKLSNTLGVKNNANVLAGSDMYMSGRALFPLTISLADKLANEFEGDLKISYSGGASFHNVEQLFDCGIYPITFATDLLKPGGYRRLKQMAELLEKKSSTVSGTSLLDTKKINELTGICLKDDFYKKEKREIHSIKNSEKLKPFDCFISPCSAACPIHQDVSEYIYLVEQEKYAEALEVIYAKNPLPNITGYICDHQCQYHCTRWDYDEPVQIREMKKIAAEKGRAEYFKKWSKPSLLNKIKVAVIGAGPSGLSASYFLAKAGFDVTVFEKEKNAGGVVQNVIPGFRLPQSAIDKDIEFIKMHNVKFNLGMNDKFLIEDMKKNGFEYVFIGIGAGKSNHIDIRSNNANLLDAIEFLRKYRNNKKISLGKNVAIIGGGNSAMDAARAAKRIPEVENVYIIYRRTKEFMPADKEELNAALKDGVIFKELVLPVEFSNDNLKCQKMTLGEFGSDGRRKVLPLVNEFETFEINSVISAIGEQVDVEFLQANNFALNEKGQIIVNNKTNETSIKNVFIGGDALRGPSTVVESIADGKKAAEEIMHRSLKNDDSSIDDVFNFINNQKRIGGIDTKKALLKNTDTNHIIEASRCLGCNLLCSKCVDVCPNRANVSVAAKGFKNAFQIIHIDSMCNECGNCGTFCPYDGLPYKDKPTLFRDLDAMIDSTNDGFYFADKDNIKLRVKESLLDININDDKINPELKLYIELAKTISSNYEYLIQI